MPAARLTQIRLRNFKCIGPEEQTVDLKPLTVLIGRNNSGKSAVIQSLMLLKQTLEDPRPEVQLALQGSYVRATGLRELTHGWPEDMAGIGPEITIRWNTESDLAVSHKMLLEEAYRGTRIHWLENTRNKGMFSTPRQLVTEMTISLQELNSTVETKSIILDTLRPVGPKSSAVRVELDVDRTPLLYWVEGEGSAFVRLDHFVPHLLPTFEREEVEFDGDDFLLDTAFGLLYEEPLRALKRLVSTVGYVSASREEIPPYYARPTSKPTRNVLPGGGNAPELLYGRRSDIIHRAAMGEPALGEESLDFSNRMVAQTLESAVNDTLRYLGIEAKLSFADVQELGLFRLLFGRAPLNHVGRGLSHLLPVVIASLLADPLLGQKLDPDSTLSDYLARCEYTPVLALEELESHLHPKVKTRLAHVLVALARSGRQIIVETHSDHLVRRLRGLIARSTPGSECEKWLLENVNIVEVEQTADGVTYLHQAQLTREGSIEPWPADFMNEAANEERAIYFAAMEKSPPRTPPAVETFSTDVLAKVKSV
jgi:hypothetical protein